MPYFYILNILSFVIGCSANSIDTCLSIESNLIDSLENQDAVYFRAGNKDLKASPFEVYVAQTLESVNGDCKIDFLLDLRLASDGDYRERTLYFIVSVLEKQSKVDREKNYKKTNKLDPVLRDIQELEADDLILRLKKINIEFTSLPSKVPSPPASLSR